MTFFYIMMVFILIASVIAIETKNLLSSIICVGAIGFGCSLMFLFMYAPDIAITQIVVEVLGLIVLIRATISRDLTFISGNRGFFGVVVSAVLVLIIAIAGVRVFDALPPFGKSANDAAIEATQNNPLITSPASKTYIAQGLKDTGAANVVAAIILDYRGYDTLGEATVLFTSIIGATVILRKKSKKSLEDLT